MRIVDILIQLTAEGLSLTLAFMMVRRRLHREYPFFFAYAVVAFLLSVTRLSVSGTYRT